MAARFRWLVVLLPRSCNMSGLPRQAASRSRAGSIRCRWPPGRAANLYVGFSAGSSGAYSLSGSGLLYAPGNEYVGFNGTGSFMQSGGTNNSLSGSLNLGNNIASSGTYSLSGSGQVFTGQEDIGLSGSGSFTQSGGTNSVFNSLLLGNVQGSLGSYTMSAGTLISRSSEQIGNAGSGSFTQSGGVNSAGGISLGEFGEYARWAPTTSQAVRWRFRAYHTVPARPHSTSAAARWVLLPHGPRRSP